MTFQKDITEKLFCPECKIKTRHEKLATHTINGIHQWNQLIEELNIIICLGCETLSPQHFLYTPALDKDGIGYDKVISDARFMKIEHNEGFPDLSITNVPELVKDIYNESARAFLIGAFRLSAIGLRSLIEITSKDLGCIERGINKQISWLNENDYLSKKQSEFLHTSRKLGNNAAHEAIEPSQQALTTSSIIINQLISATYLIKDNLN